MTAIKAISIPKPCHQSWQQMTEVSNGRHCQSCSKTVIDFTLMSNEEIVAHLSNASHVCGRFDQNQLGSINYSLYAENLPKASWWKRTAVVIGILTPGFMHKANAQVKQPVVNAGDTLGNGTERFHTLGKVVPEQVLTVHGKVTAKDDGLPIPGAMVVLKGTKTGVATDVNGNFTINVPGPESLLVISFVGYVSQTIKVTNKTLDIAMQMNAAAMGEVVIVGSVRTFTKCHRAFRRVKGLLGVHSELAIDSNIRATDF